ncbi:hypothetical protein U8326_04910 [Tsuneonella sp. CC-YZS046]|uniref:hypothetical protein n=1 Tax=Tsuneonella sp. CC-YZS046 TaxID=3042152 RepID=UPI002D78FD97|nr:hypothetical protein [Tsuneonella sp. CC-YZS046]WRO67506.1 hypothetical protein U8326_04910 [Tsuneonella sp. CC-YZS046]
MRPPSVLLVFTALLLTACEAKENGRSYCTEQIAGLESGMQTISVILLVPDHYSARGTNGSIHAINPGCDYALNAFLSRETAEHVIGAAKHSSLIHASGRRVVDAKLDIWNFQDGSGEARFFVLEAYNLTTPKTLPTFTDARYFHREETGS